MKLRNGIPRVFQFAGLKPGVRWIVNFPNTTNAEVRVGSFKTHPNDVTALSIISFSCNAVLIEPEEPSVWQDLVDMYIKPKKVDLLLHVGDQVYADSAWEEGMKLVKTAPAMTSELHEKITELYRVIYRKTWNYAPTQYTLANVPNLMIWDDHDVHNDVGINPADYDPTSKQYFVNVCARRAYWEYQKQLWTEVYSDPESTKFIESVPEYHFHKYGGIGVLVGDTRGPQSFYKDKERPFFSSSQWNVVSTALGPQGYFGDCKALIVVLSEALLVAGSKISKVGMGPLKDKMSWGLHPKEQLDFLKALSAWKHQAAAGASANAPLEKELLLIGGDLHIAVQTDVFHKKEFLCHQIVTSSIRQHSPPEVGQIILKSLMNTSEKLSDGFKFKHTLFKPRRNFGIIQVESGDGKGQQANIRTKFYYRDKKGRKSDLSKPKRFLEGELVISNISGKDLVSRDSNGLSDPYLKINVLDHLKRKTKPQFKTLNPTFHESFKIPVLSQHYKLDKNPNYKPTLTFNVWDYDKSSKDDPMGRLVVDLSEFLAVVAGADVHAHISKTFEAVPVTSMKKETVSGTLTFTVQFRPYDM